MVLTECIIIPNIAIMLTGTPSYLVTVLSGDSDLVRESLAGVGQVAGRAANHGLCLGQEN